LRDPPTPAPKSCNWAQGTANPQHPALGGTEWKTLDPDALLAAVREAVREVEQCLEGGGYVLVEGDFIYQDPRLVAMMDLKLFLSIGHDTCLQRRCVLCRNAWSRGQ
jgi:hypothetical protein